MLKFLTRLFKKKNNTVVLSLHSHKWELRKVRCGPTRRLKGDKYTSMGSMQWIWDCKCGAILLNGSTVFDEIEFLIEKQKDGSYKVVQNTKTNRRSKDYFEPYY